MSDYFADWDGRLKQRNAEATKGMSYPVRCRFCSHVHDSAKVEVVARYADCSVWRCPGCKAQIDDRPRAWGGSAFPVKGHPHFRGGAA